MANISSINPANIANLESILEKIWAKELDHYQAVFFCGTSCCLAGWDVALNSDSHPDLPENRGYWFTRGCTKAYSDPWAWSKAHNGLTIEEAYLFFSSEATKSLHKLVLAALKKGKRFTTEGVRVFKGTDTYEDGFCLVCFPNQDVLELEALGFDLQVYEGSPYFKV